MRSIVICLLVVVAFATPAFSEFYLAPNGALRPDGGLQYGVPATPVGPAPGYCPPMFTGGYLAPLYWMSYPMVPVPVTVGPATKLDTYQSDTK